VQSGLGLLDVEVKRHPHLTAASKYRFNGTCRHARKQFTGRANTLVWLSCNQDSARKSAVSGNCLTSQSCQAPSVLPNNSDGKNSEVGKIGKFIPDDDACTFEMSA
jgi:hypothetical protein